MNCIYEVSSALNKQPTFTLIPPPKLLEKECPFALDNTGLAVLHLLPLIVFNMSTWQLVQCEVLPREGGGGYHPGLQQKAFLLPALGIQVFLSF